MSVEYSKIRLGGDLVDAYGAVGGGGYRYRWIVRTDTVEVTKKGPYNSLGQNVTGVLDSF